MFVLEDKLQFLCSSQTVESITSEDNTVTGERENMLAHPVVSATTDLCLLRCAVSGTLCRGTHYSVQFSTTKDSPHHVRVRVNTTTHHNRVFLQFASDANEGFYGFGSQFSRFNMKGTLLPVFSSEQVASCMWCLAGRLRVLTKVLAQGVGRGDQPLTAIVNNVHNAAGGAWHTTYTHVPHFISR